MPTLFLCLQALASLIALRLFLRVILPGLGRTPGRGVLLDIWIPVALIGPMACFGGLAGGGNAMVGWMAVGGPVVVGAFAVGAALVTSRRDGDDVRGSTRCVAAWLGVGVLMILLACAHELSSGAGQCAFAIGAVLMWMNSPDSLPVESARRDDDHVGGAMVMALCCSAVAGASAVLAGPAAAPIAGALAVVVAAMVVAAAARVDGAGSALRLGAWCSVYGVLFGLGVMSLSVLVPEAARLLREGDVGAVRRVSYGFGAFAAEAVLLLVLPFVPAASRYVARPWRRAGGAVLILAAAVLAAARLSG